MNSSLEMQVEIGIGPQLVIIGTLIGTLFVGAVTNSITEKLSWGETSFIAIGMQDTKQNASNEISQSVAEAGSGNDQKVEDQGQNAMESTGCQVSDSYPENILQWCNEISSYSLMYGLSPDLIAAVMLQESGGNPGAYSHSGAVGLMQVMPRDGIAASFMCINGPCFTSRPTIAELQDPVFNIEYGTRMLANLLSKYEDIREALRYYGPMDAGYTYADKVLAIYENNQ